MLDGTHSEIDFPFEIDGIIFNQLYYLVDGIYPWLARFLLSIKDPTTKIDSYYASLQEAWRKDVERGFGVWKKKFLSVTHGLTMHHRLDIFYLVIATIVMHNMMVEARVARGEEECSSHYETVDNLDLNNERADQDVNEDTMSRRNNNSAASQVTNYSDVTNVNKYAVVQRRWKQLYDADSAFRLHDAVKRHGSKLRMGLEVHVRLQEKREVFWHLIILLEGLCAVLVLL
jgi:hypothetical protein